MQQAEVFWTCACGSKVWAVLDMTKVSATVRCPNPPCKVSRTLPGQITELTWKQRQEWIGHGYYRAYFISPAQIDESSGIDLLVRAEDSEESVKILDSDLPIRVI